MKSWICHKPSVGITAKRWWFVSTNFKISTSMTTLCISAEATLALAETYERMLLPVRQQKTYATGYFS